MRKRTLSGNVAIAFFIFSFICVALAFSTSSWLESDSRLTGESLDRFGLWTHCFRSLHDQSDLNQRRFFVGCRWIYDPFTSGYDQLRQYLLPGFIIATQYFYTICFILSLAGAIMVLTYFLCCGPEQNKYILLIKSISIDLFIAGVHGCIAVIIFASFANRKGWMPGHENNFFGWSFILAVIGSIFLIISSILFFVETNVQTKKQRLLRDSQTRFEMAHESKA